MTEVLIGAILVEAVVEQLKSVGLAGYSAILSLLVGIIVAVAASIELIPLDVIDNEIANQVISGIILSGGSNYVNSVRDRLKS